MGTPWEGAKGTSGQQRSMPGCRDPGLGNHLSSHRAFFATWQASPSRGAPAQRRQRRPCHAGPAQPSRQRTKGAPDQQIGHLLVAIAEREAGGECA